MANFESCELLSIFGILYILFTVSLKEIGPLLLNWPLKWRDKNNLVTHLNAFGIEIQIDWLRRTSLPLDALEILRNHWLAISDHKPLIIVVIIRAMILPNMNNSIATTTMPAVIKKNVSIFHKMRSPKLDT